MSGAATWKYFHFLYCKQVPRVGNLLLRSNTTLRPEPRITLPAFSPRQGCVALARCRIRVKRDSIRVRMLKQPLRNSPWRRPQAWYSEVILPI